MSLSRCRHCNNGHDTTDCPSIMRPAPTDVERLRNAAGYFRRSAQHGLADLAAAIDRGADALEASASAKGGGS